MREPRVSVAGRYFECMACMMFESGGDRPPDATEPKPHGTGREINARQSLAPDGLGQSNRTA